MSIFAFIKKNTLKRIGDAIRTKFGEPSTKTYLPSEMPQRILDIQTGVDISATTLSNSGQMLGGVKAYKADGELITGNIPTKTANDVSVSGRTVTVPDGYYNVPVSKSVTRGEVDAPSISVNEVTGVITSSVTKTTGYIDGGTVSETFGMATIAGDTIRPTAAGVEVVPAGVYTLGAIKTEPSKSLIGDNIKEGVKIFGVKGTYKPAGKVVVFSLEHARATSSSSQTISNQVTIPETGTYRVTFRAGMPTEKDYINMEKDAEARIYKNDVLLEQGEYRRQAPPLFLAPYGIFTFEGTFNKGDVLDLRTKEGFTGGFSPAQYKHYPCYAVYLLAEKIG